MTRSAIAVLVLTTCAAVALAQPDGPRRPPGDGPPGGPGRGPGFRGGPGFGGGMMAWMMDDLELDDAQRAKVEEIMGAQRQRMEAWGEKRMQLREAMDAGDEATAERLRKEMEAAGGDMRNMMRQAADEIEPILNDDQFARFTEMRERMEQRQGQMERARRIARELPDALNLDDTQREQFEQMLEQRRSEMRERFGGMQPMWEQMREAREAGDKEKVAELRAQMEQMQPDMNALETGFFQQVEGLLRDDQKQALTQFRAQLGGGGDSLADDSAAPEDLRQLMRALKRVRLNRSQKDEVRKIEREAQQSLRELDRKDDEGRAAVAAAAHQKINALLEPAQVQQLEDQLARLNRSRK